MALGGAVVVREHFFLQGRLYYCINCTCFFTFSRKWIMHDTGLMRKKKTHCWSRWAGLVGCLGLVDQMADCDVFSCEYLLTEEEGMEAFVDTRIHHFADSDNAFA
jgi:hypothetical protein